MFSITDKNTEIRVSDQQGSDREEETKQNFPLMDAQKAKDLIAFQEQFLACQKEAGTRDRKWTATNQQQAQAQLLKLHGGGGSNNRQFTSSDAPSQMSAKIGTESQNSDDEDPEN